MALPVNITTKTVTGKFYDMATELPCTGYITFTPSPPNTVWLLDPAATTVIVPSAKSIQLDATGAFSTTMMCTNDPDLSPLNFTWHAKLVCSNLVTEFDFSLPTSSPSTVDLSSVIIVPSFVAPPGSYVKSVNGVTPNVAGDVTLFTIAPTILDNMSDVDATTPADKDLLSFDLASTTWKKSTRLTTAEASITTLQSSRSVKYSQNTAQTMTNANNIKMQYPNAIRTDAAVATAGGTSNDTFTASLTGTYTIAASIRCLTSGAQPSLAVYQPGNVAFSTANVKAGQSASSRYCNVQCRLDLSAGSTFAVNCFNEGTTSNVDTTFGSATHITIRYEGV
jgi:hypothetical protein